MIRLANCFTEKLILLELINPSESEIYRYGAERLLGKLMNFTALLILALCLRTVIPGLFFLLFLLTLRGRTGGYHASTQWRCFLGTMLVFAIAEKVILPFLIGRNWLAFCCLGVACVVIAVWAPVNHPNLDFNAYEILQYRRRARVALLIELAAIAIFVKLNISPECYISAILGVAVCAVLVAVAKITGQEANPEISKENFNS